MKCSYILQLSLRDRKTTMHQNVVPKMFHTQNLRHHQWKTVRTTLQSLVVLQLRGEVMKSRKIMGQVCIFQRFLQLLAAIG